METFLCIISTGLKNPKTTTTIIGHFYVTFPCPTFAPRVIHILLHLLSVWTNTVSNIVFANTIQVVDGIKHLVFSCSNYRESTYLQVICFSTEYRGKVFLRCRWIEHIHTGSLGTDTISNKNVAISVYLELRNSQSVIVCLCSPCYSTRIAVVVVFYVSKVTIIHKNTLHLIYRTIAGFTC